MWKMAGLFSLAVPAAALWACAGNPGPGDAGYPFNLSGAYAGEIVVDATPFGVVMEVQTRMGGALEGSYEVRDPVSMSGSVAGTIVADSVSFTLQYMNPLDGCGGVLEGEGTVDEGGGALSGRVSVNDSCGGYLAGTFAMQK